MNLKNVVFTTLACCSILAHADSGTKQKIIVTDELTDNGNEISSLYFNTNGSHAWVEAIMDNTRFPDNPTDQKRVLVDGLTYDTDKKQLLFAHDGRQIDCANMEGPTWYRWSSKLVLTGSCNLTGRVDIRTAQNEFGESYDYSVLHIDMDVESAQRSNLNIYDRENAGDATVSASFKVNSTLKRAWIELSFGDRTDDQFNQTGDPADAPRYRVESLKLDRLKFDSQTSSVVIMSSDLKTIESVCAKYIPAHGLFSEYVQQTGKCCLSADFLFRDVDNGIDDIQKNVRFVRSTLTD